MAGTIISKDPAITWFESATEGFEKIGLTNYDNDNEPAVAAGSKVEINGQIYKFDLEEAITGWSGISNDTQAYIKFVVSGSDCTVEFTDTVSTYDNAKGGWYVGNDRHLFSLYKDSSGNYTLKAQLTRKDFLKIYDTIEAIKEIKANDYLTTGEQPFRIITHDIGIWDMDTDSTLLILNTGNNAAGDEAVQAFDPDNDAGLIKVDVIIYGDSVTGGGGSFNSRTGYDINFAGNVEIVPFDYVSVNNNFRIDLRRETGGFFDSTDFNSSTFNRGIFIITYDRSKLSFDLEDYITV